MSNLPINNAVSMNQNYLPQEREMPAVDKSRDPLLSKVFTNSVVLDNGAGQKHANVMVNRDALERLFDMFESAIRAIRSMLAGHDVMPKPLPDAGVLKKTTPEFGLDSTLNSDKALKPLPKAGLELKTAPEADAKAQAVSDIASKMLSNAGAQPQVPVSSTAKSKSPAEPAPANTPASAPVKSGDAKAAGKLLSEIASKPLPDARLQPQLLSAFNAQSTLPADVAAKPIKPDAKSLSEITSKALQDARMQSQVMSEAKSKSQLNSDADFKVRPEPQVLTKTLHRDVPGVRSDAAQENKQTSDVNVTVQVINCGFHHPEANFIAHRRDTPRVDSQPTLTLNTPQLPKFDGQPTLTLNTPQPPKVDGQPTLTLNTPQPPKFDGQPTLTLNTPQLPKVDGQPSQTLNTPQPPKVDGQPTPTLNTPNNPEGVSAPVKPDVESRSPVATPATDTASTGPLPSFKPENRPKLDLTAAGPADDHSADIFNSRNRTWFDNARASSANRQTRA